MPCLWERLVRATRHGDRGMPGQAGGGLRPQRPRAAGVRDLYVDEDFEPVGYRCGSCGIEDRDLGNIAESSPWTIGTRAVLPDGTEARVEAIGPDRIMGNYREPTAICADASYLVRDLRTIDHVHADQLALQV